METKELWELEFLLPHLNIKIYHLILVSPHTPENSSLQVAEPVNKAITLCSVLVANQGYRVHTANTDLKILVQAHLYFQKEKTVGL